MAEPAEITRLRRDGALQKLPDGTESVLVTLQYQGSVPALPRAQRKQWLLERFSGLYGHEMELVADSVSPSGQTIEGLCAVARIDEARGKVEANNDRLDIVQLRNVHQ
ncbi:MAG: hypothetical protein QM674_10255 [Burkholderiaceae bacterium]